MPEQAFKTFFADAPKPEFVEVALPIPLRQTFTYSIPVGMREVIEIGSRVLVPFGSRYLTGYAVILHETLSEELEIEESAVKEIAELLDDEPLITKEILGLTQWAADYYASSWGEVLKASLPAGINATVEEIVNINSRGQDELTKTETSKTVKLQILNFLNKNGETALRELKKKFGAGKTMRAVKSLLLLDFIYKFSRTITSKVKPKRRKAVRLLPIENHKPNAKKLTETHQKIIDFLIEFDGEILFTDLIEKADVGASPINTLAKYGFVEVFVKEVFRDPLSEAKIPEIQDLILTDQQKQVLSQINSALDVGKYKGFLLHGVTGSGKTEVYIRAMKSVLNKGKSALMLVPEIALTPVFSKRLRAVFGDEVAILHSSLSTGERFDEWRRIRKGDARVVIGTRSAVFAPLKNLGLIVVDEEHDTSYRQHEMPFYNGRDVAIVRANFADAVVILGSATPALESFHNSHIGKYDYLTLPNRVGNRPLATAEIIDMREVFKEAGKDLIFSPALEDAIQETHGRGEQSIILLNRRGFSQFVLCRSCGETIKCNNCDITLTYHKREQNLVCHYCNHREKVPHKCPECESKFLYFMGEGTEQIENLLQRKFSELRIARVDRDTTRRKHEMENVLSAFSDKKLDMLVGTQMLAKGHDFPNVTLVGVISVDTGLSLPDFRSAERTFQLLTQVAGRAGRGSLPGRVLIQTYYPEHYALKHSKTQNYDEFYEQEIAFREKLHYPPFVALSSILIKHPNYNYAHDNAQILRSALDAANTEKQCIILGPAPASLPRLKGEHRLQILIKSRNRNHLRETIDFALAEAEAKFCDLKIIYVEIDPINLL
ncbi:MAG: primosomal protein N' [Acidobacteriota bacterium]|jgi:primosomal protein N' (replication factor Y)|nr:primosomal protein N' [Acidobacteriota bacterium]